MNQLGTIHSACDCARKFSFLGNGDFQDRIPPQQSAAAAKRNTKHIAFALLMLFNVMNVLHSTFLKMKWLVQTRD
jgi:hypothetical protein